jgi:magnesium transporter
MGAPLRIASKFAADHPTEAAGRLERLSPAEGASFLENLDPNTAAGVLERMLPAIGASCVELMEARRAAEMFALSTTRYSVPVLRHVRTRTRDHILGLLPQDLAMRIRRILHFPVGSAGAMADSSVEAFPYDMAVGDARRVTQDARLPYVFVVDREQKLVGVVHRRDLRQSEEHATLGSIGVPKVTRVPGQTTVAELQRHPGWREFDALPVVDGKNVFLGVIRHKTLRGLREPRTPTSRTGKPLDTFVDLAELYWLGLSTMVAALAEGTAAQQIGERHNDP